MIWKEKRLLIDGHTRFRLLSLLGRPYEIVEMSFPNRAAVLAWMGDLHYGRRNLSAEHKSYLRGQQILAMDVRRGGDRRSMLQRATLLLRQVAERYHVDRVTLHRDRCFATALDRVATCAGDEVRCNVLSREWRWTRGDVIRLAKLRDAELRRTVARAVADGRRPRFGDRRAKRKGLVLPNQPADQVVVLIEHLGKERVVKLASALSKWAGRNGRARVGSA